MSNNILASIVENRRRLLDCREAFYSELLARTDIPVSTRSLAEALSGPGPSFIFECKKASPSKGLIREHFSIAEIMADYGPFASAISVLTEPDYFAGDIKYLTEASQLAEQPILCKDFIVRPEQLIEARLAGADAALLMLSVLDDENYKSCAEMAEQLRLDVLTEVHSEEELERALSLDARIIGINNRNLKNLSIDLSTTKRLASKIPDDILVVSESGIENHQQVLALSPFVDGFLVGSSLMGAPNLSLALRRLVYGEVKICGIRSEYDLAKVARAGASYAGLMLTPISPRFVDAELAKLLARNSPLPMVGVVLDQSIADVAQQANELALHAVQLHGSESAQYVSELRQQLNPEIHIWKVVKVAHSVVLPELSSQPEVARWLLDNGNAKVAGGSGESFDWSLLEGIDPEQIIVAGGIDADNIAQLKALGVGAIDLSSAVESSPGIKDSGKLNKLFAAIRRGIPTRATGQ